MRRTLWPTLTHWEKAARSATRLGRPSPSARCMLNIEARPAVLGLIFMACFAGAAQDKPPDVRGLRDLPDMSRGYLRRASEESAQRGGEERAPAWKGRACESCHGPGGTHATTASADDIRNPAKLTAALADKTCLTCHAGGRQHAAVFRAAT